MKTIVNTDVKMKKKLELENLFYIIQLAIQSAIGEDKEFTIETEQELDVIYNKLKKLIDLE
jgi:hypothetical protein